MPKYFNRAWAENNRQGHHSVTVDNKTYHFPIVRGVVWIPDDLKQHVTLPPEWEPYHGQVATSHEELQPIKDVDAYYSQFEKQEYAPSHIELTDDQKAKAKADKAAADPTVNELKEQAKELGIEGYSKLKKDELIAAIEEAKAAALAAAQIQN